MTSTSLWGVEEVTVSYPGHKALDDVDLELEPGSISSVVGGDGAGKTTLARLMAGLVRPTAGHVRKPSERHIGYQSEASGVWRDLTVTENLSFVASAHRLGGAARAQRIDRLLELTRLGPSRDLLASRLSGGMRQKLGVAMALLPDPQLLILDEPTTGLDPVSRTDLWTMIAHAAAQGTAVLATTTYFDEAERAGKVLALDDGRTLASGSVDVVRAATPGVVVETDGPTGSPYGWRRGHRWRTWCPDGALPAGGVRVEPDLSDLVMVAALSRNLDTAP